MRTWRWNFWFGDIRRKSNMEESNNDLRRNWKKRVKQLQKKHFNPSICKDWTELKLDQFHWRALEPACVKNSTCKKALFDRPALWLRRKRPCCCACLESERWQNIPQKGKVGIEATPIVKFFLVRCKIIVIGSPTIPKHPNLTSLHIKLLESVVKKGQFHSCPGSAHTVFLGGQVFQPAWGRSWYFNMPKIPRFESQPNLPKHFFHIVQDMSLMSCTLQILWAKTQMSSS